MRRNSPKNRCPIPGAALALALVTFASGIASAAAPTRYFDGAAREIIGSLKAGNGWCVVTDRRLVSLLEESEAVDCIKYAVVVSYTAGTTSNDQTYVELKYRPETPWIAVQCGGPTASGPSLTAAKQLNEAIGKIDESLAGLNQILAEADDADVKALWHKVAGAMRQQRAALTDLIQKDIGAVEMATGG